MSSYAILGATGRVGGTILQLLVKDPSNELHLYARSKSKLLQAHPELEEHGKVSIYEGDLKDVKVIKRCIEGTSAVFLAVALSENLPGCSIAMDTAKVVVEALQQLRTEQSDFRPPRLVVLSSSSVTDTFWKGKPQIVHNVIFNANCNIYVDLQHAEKYLRDQGDDLRLTFVKPGGLVDDIQRGYQLDTEKMHTPMSFGDLAAAMIEIAGTNDERWNKKDVGVIPKSDGASVGLGMPCALGKGLMACYFPSFYMYVRTWLP